MWMLLLGCKTYDGLQNSWVVVDLIEGLNGAKEYIGVKPVIQSEMIFMGLGISDFVYQVKTSSLSSHSPLRSFTACLHNRTKKHQWNRLNDVSVPGVRVGHCSQTCMFMIQPCPEILAENLTTKLLSSQTPTKLIQHSWLHTFVKVFNI